MRTIDARYNSNKKWTLMPWTNDEVLTHIQKIKLSEGRRKIRKQYHHGSQESRTIKGGNQWGKVSNEGEMYSNEKMPFKFSKQEASANKMRDVSKWADVEKTTW